MTFPSESTTLPAPPTARADKTAFAILIAISVSHFVNDATQALLPASYPILKSSLGLDFTQIGLITFVVNVTASIGQPAVGFYTDHRPKPFSLPVGMGFSLVGILLLAVAPSFPSVLLAAVLIGLGSSVFHPESARVARLASGGRLGMAQSIFQVGGNAGAALSPLLVAAIVVPHGQPAIAWFSVATLLGMLVLWNVSGWYRQRPRMPVRRGFSAHAAEHGIGGRRVAVILAMLGFLIFSKYFYVTSFSSYYTFYLIEKFDVSVLASQLFLFLYLASVAIGTLIGGPLGDRFGRKLIILGSIFGTLPFALALPYADLTWTAALTIPIGLIISSAFSAMLVYGQELLPGRIGTISGLFFGFAFGMGGICAALLGVLADHIGIEQVYQICSYLPALGIIAAFLPDLGTHKSRRTAG